MEREEHCRRRRFVFMTCEIETEEHFIRFTVWSCMILQSLVGSTGCIYGCIFSAYEHNTVVIFLLFSTSSWLYVMIPGVKIPCVNRQTEHADQRTKRSWQNKVSEAHWVT
jgi:hypothetical protein